MSLTRRTMLVGASSACVSLVLGGCALSARDRANNAILAAIRADPLFDYKPAWVTRVDAQEVKADGVYGSDTTLIRKFLIGAIPFGAWNTMTTAAREAGWDLTGISPQKAVLHGGSRVLLSLHGTETADSLMVDFIGVI